DPIETDDHSPFGQSRRAHRKFPRLTIGEISGGARGVWFSQQSTRGRRSARFRLSRSAGGPDRRSNRGTPLRGGRLSQFANCGRETAGRRSGPCALDTKTRLKFFAALFAPDRGEENYHQKNNHFP